MRVEAIPDVSIRGSPETEQAEARKPTRSSVAPPAPEPPKASETSPAKTDPDSGEQDVQQVLEGMNSFLQAMDHQLQFSLHQASKQMMVRVIDRETEEVIKTIPAQELLDLQAKIGEMVGTLIDSKT